MGFFSGFSPKFEISSFPPPFEGVKITLEGWGGTELPETKDFLKNRPKFSRQGVKISRFSTIFGPKFSILGPLEGGIPQKGILAPGRVQGPSRRGFDPQEGVRRVPEGGSGGSRKGGPEGPKPPKTRFSSQSPKNRPEKSPKNSKNRPKSKKSFKKLLYF